MRRPGIKGKIMMLSIIGCIIGYVRFIILDDGRNQLSGKEKLLNAARAPFEVRMPEKQEANLSILGKWLHAPDGTPPPPLNAESALDPEKRLLILIWKWGPALDRRHVRYPDKQNSRPPFPSEGCSVKTCDLTYRDEDLAIADAVVFHLQRTRGVHELPSTKGKPNQIWIFLTDEAPFHIFMYAPGKQGHSDFSQYDGVFDWSMSYRDNSDVPVPYGRTIMRKNTDDNERQRVLEKRRKKLVAMMHSDCGAENQRWDYVKKLKSVLGEKLEMIGPFLGGNTTVCPGYMWTDCPILDTYKFYLAFENSNCREYITEKVFWNAYSKGSVPIIMGAPRADLQRLLPPHSFIYTADFKSPNELADYIRYLDNNDDAYDEYHAWRSNFIVLNEHGYFGSRSIHYCRICEALRYNIRPAKLSKYQRMNDVFNTARDCY